MAGPGREDFGQRVEALDETLFAPIGRPGWRGDSRSLLALHAATGQVKGTFSYLEIGSYLGSSLQLAVADPRCTSVASIDLRPEVAPDARGESRYPGNSTARMLELLDNVPGARLDKLRTYESDAADIDAAELLEPPHLCFIDGEHTHRAALSDARFCRRVAAADAALVFHDRAVVATAIAEFIADLERDGERFFAYALPSYLFVIELGGRRLFDTVPVSRVAGRSRALWVQANRNNAARRIRALLVAEQRARRGLPAWLRRPISSVANRRRREDVSAVGGSHSQSR